MERGTIFLCALALLLALLPPPATIAAAWEGSRARVTWTGAGCVIKGAAEELGCGVDGALYDTAPKVGVVYRLVDAGGATLAATELGEPRVALPLVIGVAPRHGPAEAAP